VRGVWNGVGLTATAAFPGVAAATVFDDLPAGQYRFTARLDQITADHSSAPRVILSSSGRDVATVDLLAPPDIVGASSVQPIQSIAGVIDHPGGNLRLDFTVATTAPTTVWLSDPVIARVSAGQQE
jgi:hypothetical protein